MDLMKELRNTLTEIDLQILQVETQAHDLHIKKTQLQDRSGNFVMIPLLTARASVLESILKLALAQETNA